MTPLTRHADCRKCDQLWTAYANAISTAVRLQGKLRVAEIAHDHVGILQIRPAAEKANSERQQLREMIASHGLNVPAEQPLTFN